MTRYLIRRLIQMIPLLVFISLISFMISALAPGDPVNQYINPSKRPPTQEELAVIRHRYGLDRPVYIRYFYWLRDVVKGDWGYSMISKNEVADEVLSRLPQTVLLSGLSLVFAIVVAIPLGVLSAVKRYTVLDYVLTFTAFLGISLPTFWFALLLVYLFSNTLGWLPSVGMSSVSGNLQGIEKTLDVAKHLVLPVLALSFSEIASWMRYQRAALLENLQQDFVRTARSKGLKESTVIWRHAFRNSLVTVVTLIGLSLPWLVNGSYITESIFGWPGMGRLGITSIMGRDYPVVMMVTMLSALMVICGNLLSDIMYALVDPRTRFD
ncbi:MAG: ABC transporter permease [Chloroflexi bacterium]|nr:ABC transporter permease [Chloroflexota bacterium]